MKSGYTMISTLAIMFFLSGLIIGLNSITSANIRRSKKSQDDVTSQLVSDSLAGIARAIIIGNMTRPVDDPQRLPLDGTGLSCVISNSIAATIRIQDVAGLADLKYVPDELLKKILSSPASGRPLTQPIEKIRALANSSIYISAKDVFLAAGLAPSDAENLAEVTTVHGQKPRLAREVTPSSLIALLNGSDSAIVFGAPPSNSIFRIQADAYLGSGVNVGVSQIVSLNMNSSPLFRKLYEVREVRFVSAEAANRGTVMSPDAPELISCRN